MKSLGMQDELSAFSAFVGGGERDFVAELIWFVSFAFADTFCFWRMP